MFHVFSMFVHFRDGAPGGPTHRTRCTLTVSTVLLAVLLVPACASGPGLVGIQAAGKPAPASPPDTPLVTVTHPPPGPAPAPTAPPATPVPIEHDDGSAGHHLSEVPSWHPDFPGFTDAVPESEVPWVHVARAPWAVAEWRNQGFATVDRSLVEAAWAPGAPGSESDLAAVDALAATGRRRADDGLVIEETAAVWFTETEAVVRVVHSHGPERAVEADGSVVDLGPGWAPEEDWWHLVREPGGAHFGVGWRLAGWYDLPPEGSS